MSTLPYKKIHVVINPASGKDEPVLNVLNDVFHQYEDIEWTISVTKKYGDATAQAREAAEVGADLVAGYGGDGTQHEIANGILGTTAVPDLVILDWELPGLADFGSITALRANNPNLYIVVLSGHNDVRQNALDAGTNWFVSKTDPLEKLLAALENPDFHSF